MTMHMVPSAHHPPGLTSPAGGSTRAARHGCPELRGGLSSSPRRPGSPCPSPPVCGGGSRPREDPARPEHARRGRARTGRPASAASRSARPGSPNAPARGRRAHSVARDALSYRHRRSWDPDSHPHPPPGQAPPSPRARPGPALAGPCPPGPAPSCLRALHLPGTWLGLTRLPPPCLPFSPTSLHGAPPPHRGLPAQRPHPTPPRPCGVGPLECTCLSWKTAALALGGGSPAWGTYGVRAPHGE